MKRKIKNISLLIMGLMVRPIIAMDMGSGNIAISNKTCGEKNSTIVDNSFFVNNLVDTSIGGYHGKISLVAKNDDMIFCDNSPMYVWAKSLDLKAYAGHKIVLSEGLIVEKGLVNINEDVDMPGAIMVRGGIYIGVKEGNNEVNIFKGTNTFDKLILASMPCSFNIYDGTNVFQDIYVDGEGATFDVRGGNNSFKRVRVQGKDIIINNSSSSNSSSGSKKKSEFNNLGQAKVTIQQGLASNNFKINGDAITPSLESGKEGVNPYRGNNIFKKELVYRK